MRECYSSVVWIAFLYEDVTVEASHLWYSEDANTTELACRDIKHLTFGDV